jgi:hypothetical protein
MVKTGNPEDLNYRIISIFAFGRRPMGFFLGIIPESNQPRWQFKGYPQSESGLAPLSNSGHVIYSEYRDRE